MSKRSRDAIQVYTRLLRLPDVLGRMRGIIKNAPACRVVRQWTGKGVSRYEFVHVYDHGLCACDAMKDVRTMASQHHRKPGSKETCIHVEALDALDGDDVQPIEEYGPVAVLGKESLSVALSSEPFSRSTVTVDLKKNRYACCSCTHCKYTCPHVQTIRDTVIERDLSGVEPFLDELGDDVGAHRETATSKSTSCISWKRIPFDSCINRVLQRTASVERSSQWIERGTECIPSGEGVCDACKTPWAQSSLVLVEAHGMLYGPSESLNVRVYERHCECGQVRVYDGMEDGVFNMSNKTLWLHEVMLFYLDLMIEARMPFNAFYNTVRRQYERHGKSTVCSRSTVTTSIEAFLDLIDIDYEDCFTCPVCSQLPTQDQVYIIDGKCMGFRRESLVDHDNSNTRQETVPTIPGTNFTYIGGSKKAQKFAAFLRAYARGDRDVDFKALVRGAREHAPELVPVFEYIKDAGTSVPCPRQYRHFFYDVASPCPMSCWIPRELVTKPGGILDPVLTRLLDAPTLTEDDRRLLMTWGSFAEAMSGKEAIPAAFKPLVETLAQLARLPGSFISDAQSAVQRDSSTTPPDPLSFFPNHPKLRTVRAYDGVTIEDSVNCTKNVLKSKRFTPGIFGVWCPHGINIGFEVLREYESAKIPFKIFYERFSAAPGTVIFDNACNASRYCLRREPLFFSKTRFWIDRLHQHNHTLCHSGYNMKWKPDGTELLGGRLTLGQLNTQVAEQCHAKMELIATQTSFMSQNTYLQYVKVFIALTNRDMLKKFYLQST